MPITPSGQKALASMQKEYGAEKGKSVFYALANKRKKLGSKWHAVTATTGKKS